MIPTFTEDNFHTFCDTVAATDEDLKNIITKHGYPPFWSRTPTFATLIHIILQQQVSLASAKAAFLKLQEKIGHFTPEKLLLFFYEELKACYFSRQKIIYARHLASALVDGMLNMEALEIMPDDEIRAALKKVKGIGDWTVDVYLMMVLHRTDLFPPGDIALMTSIKELKNLPKDIPREVLLSIAEQWKPYRTIAAYLVWHAYLEKRKPKVLYQPLFSGHPPL